ncbi:hypothetical protein Pmar_PMAR016951 [Perkinsus marinus ATCC 50983]|uniref:AN1-type domain-containing protein n=1 Tax=Perkinsus marinus (strain ATCC 50983 / TXsc) TaxID=423536 RepID=C5KNQ8_PERM5|nr:hypothetical protein Pmar_PMAR016951 [Perkinsus marinus ATCC 50983]EER13885.1 hypothetical protein Pmar_PMAR016951 [Perkinsus marinus ATCC 50983]|eukprot:XP_002782090.1 hypothetical protein Pmar_PMAR016951 [Perkinsus marinus ATCC 50983]
MYLDKAFNVKEIVQHFACMYPGCMKPLLTSTTPCKCSGMFCDVHAHPLRHPCRDTELRLKGAMTLPEANLFVRLVCNKNGFQRRGTS